jgi:hypothetical protein
VGRVRRRPKYIVVSDASEDHTYNFESLANAIEKIRVDLGIRIEAARERKFGRKTNLVRSGAHCTESVIPMWTRH